MYDIQGKNSATLVRALAVIGGVVVLSMGACVVCAGIGAASHVTGANAATTAAAPARLAAAVPPLQVTAGQLFAAYKANEVAADAHYKGRALLVTGAVASIDKDAFGAVIVQLETANPFEPVRATLDSGQASKAADLTKGQSVVVACEGAGMLIGDPLLSDCSLR